jgi:hypothetical protein
MDLLKRSSAGYHAGENFSSLSRTLKVGRRIVYKHVDRALAAGVDVALRDRPHGSAPTITPEAKVWVLALAGTKPKEHGQAAELWTLAALAKHIGRTAQAAGHPSVANVVKSTVHAILRNAPLRPHKIKYYLERRDPEFERKMKEVLIVYREVAELEQPPPPVGTPRIVTVSVDGKPGVQALATTSADLPPVSGVHPEVGRDYEYKRLGTASISAGLDLQDGHVTARLENATAASSSSDSCRIWIPTIRPKTRFACSWTITPPTSRRRRWPTSPPGPIASSTCLHPNTAPG